MYYEFYIVLINMSILSSKQECKSFPNVFMWLIPFISYINQQSKTLFIISIQNLVLALNGLLPWLRSENFITIYFLVTEKFLLILSLLLSTFVSHSIFSPQFFPFLNKKVKDD